MLIIDGHMGKSKKLEEILRKQNSSINDTLILDSENIPGLNSYGQHYIIPKNMTQEIEEFLEDRINRNPNIKYVVLEFNTSRRLIPIFKELETKTNKEFILTVQCPAEEAKEEIKVYDV